ncbi:MAG: 50S ribosomal protein L24 [Alphaproteobacteria bacterium]|nr:50S ribosomal protein L24 [Alphaproteobacteria bacterium]
MATKCKIKTKDKVIVLAGKDKGKTGDVTAVMPKEGRVLVSGVNMVARHTKPSQANPQGGIVRREASIHMSNVALIDPKTNKATRAGYKTVKGVKTRIARRSGEDV